MAFKKRYLFNTIFILTFCFASQVWGDDLRILTCEEAPANYLQDGELMGTTVDIVEEIMGYLGVERNIEILPCNRAYTYTQKRSNVIFFTCARTQERINEGFHFIGPVITREHVLWKRKGADISINSINDIKQQDLSIGSMIGEWRGKYFKDRQIRVLNEYSHEFNARNLITGKIDLWASSDIEALSVLKRVGYSLEAVELAYVINSSPSYIMLSRDMHPEAIEKWEGAFREILSNRNFIKGLEEKWSDKLGAKLVFLKNKGLMISHKTYP